MEAARLHDGSGLDVAVLGDGPTVLLPVSLTVVTGDTAEQMRAWGADPGLGLALATGLVDAGLQVIAADYERHLAEQRSSRGLTR